MGNAMFRIIDSDLERQHQRDLRRMVADFRRQRALRLLEVAEILLGALDGALADVRDIRNRDMGTSVGSHAPPDL